MPEKNAMMVAVQDEQKKNFALLVAHGVPLIKASRLKEQSVIDQVGISPATAYRWLQEPEVAEAITAAQRKVRQGLYYKLFGGAHKTVDALIDAADGSIEVSPTRMKAIQVHLGLLGMTPEQIVKHIGDAAEPIVIVRQAPHNPDARAQQEQRRMAQARPIEVTVTSVTTEDEDEDDEL